jgi:hypothetical protein
MNRRAILISAVVLIGTLSYPQDHKLYTKGTSGFRFNISGGHYFQFSKTLNAQLREWGYPDFTDGSTIFGMGLQGSEGKWNFGLDFYLVWPEYTKTDYSENMLTSWNYLVKFGYRLLQIKKFSISPSIGIGEARTKLTIEPQLIDTDSFDDILEQPGRASTIKGHDFILDFSLVADSYVYSRRNESGDLYGYAVGVEFGYLLSLLNSWKFYGDDLVDTPGSIYTGPYISLIFSVAGVWKK